GPDLLRWLPLCPIKFGPQGSLHWPASARSAGKYPTAARRSASSDLGFAGGETGRVVLRSNLRPAGEETRLLLTDSVELRAGTPVSVSRSDRQTKDGDGGKKAEAGGAGKRHRSSSPDSPLLARGQGACRATRGIPRGYSRDSPRKLTSALSSRVPGGRLIL